MAVPVAEMPSPRRLRNWQTRRDQTDRILVRRAEGFLLFAQGVWIVVTSSLDKVNPDGQKLLAVVAALHFIAAIVALWRGGPFLHGGVWVWLWVGAALLTPVFMAGLVPIGEYGASSACFQLCGYPVAPIALLAFFPWLGMHNEDIRPAISALIAVLIAAMPLALMLGINGDLSPANWLGWANGASGYFLAYLGGMMFGAIARDTYAAQVDAQQEAYTEIFNTLHDNVHTTLDAVRQHHDRSELAAARSKLDALTGIVKDERIRLTTEQSTISVSHLVSRQVAQIAGVVEVVGLRPLGAIHVKPEVGIFLNRAIGALCRNVIARPGVTRIKIDVRIIEGALIVLEVCNDGPGFDGSIIEDSWRSLHKLRKRARDLDGDLVKINSPEFTTCIQVWVPLDSEGHGAHESSARRRPERGDGTSNR